MVTRTKHIIFAALAVIITGCNPGIIDVPPGQLSNIKEYFWHPDTVHAPNYVRTMPPNLTVVQDFTLVFDGYGTNSYKVRDEVNASSSPFTLTIGTDKITVSHLSPTSLIPLPERYNVVSEKFENDTVATPRKIKTVLVTGRDKQYYTSIALDDSGYMYQSLNNGQNWSKTMWNTMENGTITALAVSPSYRNVYVGTSAGKIFVSSDFGMSWTIFSNYGTGSVTALCVSNEGYVYAGTSTGLGFRILENSQTVDFQNLFDFKSGAFTSLAVIDSSLNSRFPTVVGGIQGKGLFYMVLDGKGWFPALPLNYFTKVTQIVRHGSSSLLAIGTQQGGVSKVAINEDSAIDLWSDINAPTGVKYLSGTFTEGTSYMATEGGIVYTLSSGVSTSGATAKTGKVIHSISSLEGFVITATDSGVVVSTDKGLTWTTHSLGLESIKIHTKQVEGELVILQSTGDTLQVGSTWKAGFISFDSIPPIPITARISEHFSVFTLPDKVEYTDVFRVTYSYEENVGVSLPNLKICFAKNIGPIMIDQYMGAELVNRTYYKK